MFQFTYCIFVMGYVMVHEIEGTDDESHLCAFNRVGLETMPAVLNLNHVSTSLP